MTVALPLSHTHTYSHVKRADNPQLLVSDMQERKKTIKTNINKHHKYHKYQICRREYDCLNAASSGSSCGIYTENTSATGQTPNPRPYKHSLHLFLHKQDAGSLSYQHQVSRLLRVFSCSQEEAQIMWPEFESNTLVQTDICLHLDGFEIIQNMYGPQRLNHQPPFSERCIQIERNFFLLYAH